MTTYSDLISRDASNDPLVPAPQSANVIQVATHSSAVLSRARIAPMSTKTSRTPVLSTLPTAYFVSGDTGLKQTSNADWENLDLVAEEIAVIIPVPRRTSTTPRFPSGTTSHRSPPRPSARRSTTPCSGAPTSPRAGAPPCRPASRRPTTTSPRVCR